MGELWLPVWRSFRPAHHLVPDQGEEVQDHQEDEPEEEEKGGRDGQDMAEASVFQVVGQRREQVRDEHGYEKGNQGIPNDVEGKGGTQEDQDQQEPLEPVGAVFHLHGDTILDTWIAFAPAGSAG